MRRPHVFERSAPRRGSTAHQELASQATVGRTLAAQLGNMIDKATGAELPRLSELLDAARVEAERIAVAHPASGPV